MTDRPPGREKPAPVRMQDSDALCATSPLADPPMTTEFGRERIVYERCGSQMHPTTMHGADVSLPDLDSLLAQVEAQIKLMKLQQKGMTSRAEFFQMLALRLQILARDLRPRPL